MIIDGVLGSEAIDSSGEVLDVQGADISDVEAGTCLLNWEHLPGEKSASTLVGVVLAAKKIYGREDCENDRQRMYWDEIQLPFIYGISRLYDGAGHEEAKRIAAIIRDHTANNELVVCRYSVEGATLDKKQNRLKETAVRRVAITVKPCNRTAISGLIEDPNAPAGFEKKLVKERVRDLLDFESTEKSEFDNPMFQRLGRSHAIAGNPIVGDELAKTYTAGMPSGAPGTLTQGAALQREDLGPKRIAKQAAEMVEKYGDKPFNRAECRSFAKTLMPEASDEFLDHFLDIVEDYHVKRTSLAKKEGATPAVKTGKTAPATPKIAAPKPVSAAPKSAGKPVKTGKKPVVVDEEDAAPVKITHGTIRGVPTLPQKIRGVHFDENTGVLHTQKGSFPLYNPDKGFQLKEDAKGAPHYEGGVLHVAPGTDTSKFHNAANPGFREIYNSAPIEDFHSGKVMPNWTRVHELTKNGKLPEEVIMHAAIFSMLSPNTPVRPHELMYAHMANTFEDLGIDPRDENFKSARQHWLDKDKGQNYPRIATDYFRTHADVHLGTTSDPDATEPFYDKKGKLHVAPGTDIGNVPKNPNDKSLGRKTGDLMSFMLGENKFKNIAQYHKLHATMRDLVAKHGTDARAASAELMKMKSEHVGWISKRAQFKKKVKDEAAAKLGMRDDFDEYVGKAVEKARATGLMGPKGESRTGDTGVKKQIVEKAKQLGLKNHLSDYAERATQEKIGDFKGTAVPGLAPKTGRFAFTMLGGGNSFVPDTHIVRHLFGMDNKKDSDTLAYLKSVLWNSNNHHVLEGIDRWYAKNHPAAQLMQTHEKWGKHFEDDKEMANFPAFWRHWCTIAPDERARGLPNQSANEFSTHEPYWMGISRFMKFEGGTGELDDRMVAKMVAMHHQYAQDHGEIPAQMMYFTHLVPHLLEAAAHRTTHDDLADFAKSVAHVQALGVELRKASTDLQVADYADPKVPTVFKVDYKAGKDISRAGRFMIWNNRVYHLEDYYGLLKQFLPEGRMNLQKLSQLHGLKMSPHLEVTEHALPEDDEPENKGAPASLAPAPRPPSVFEYHRAGHDKPHVLEVKDGVYLLDGERLSHPEVQTILANHKSGTATIRYKSGMESPAGKIEKMEAMLTTLAKGDPYSVDDPNEQDELLQHMRRAESLGHLPPGSSDKYSKHVYEDDKAHGVGNAKAWQNFQAKTRPGVYVQMDGNDFREVNNNFGHQTGDHAITAMGGALRDAANEAAPGVHKLFRSGGDEFVAHFPSHEHAARFARAVSEKLNAVAPVGGAHKLSMSFGFGPDPHTADMAMYEAKKQKIHPATGQRVHKIGQVPNMAHSLMPGHEGPVQIHTGSPEHTLATTMRAPASSAPKPVPLPPKSTPVASAA